MGNMKLYFDMNQAFSIKMLIAIFIYLIYLIYNNKTLKCMCISVCVCVCVCVCVYSYLIYLYNI